MRTLVLLVVLVAAGFVLTAMYVVPGQPDLRDWYGINVCPHLDKLSPRICGPIRQARGTERS